MVDHMFFDKAFELYRRRYNDDSKKVMFLLVSDDTNWIKENLGKHEDVWFGADYSSNKLSGTNLVGFDLCVLASSDHSIFSYGTFGLWGSLLAGGDVITSKGLSNKTFTEEDDLWKLSVMPGWLYVDTWDKKNVTVLKIDSKTREFVIVNV